MRLQLRHMFALLVCFVSIVSFAPAHAHPVVVDASASEWTRFGTGPREKQVGHIIRNNLNQGEYAWSDGLLDNRVVANDALRVESDLRQLRITGTATDMYVYAKFARLSAIGGPQTVQLQLAMRTNFAATSSNAHFVAPATTKPSLPSTAAWQYLLRTTFNRATPTAADTVVMVQPELYTSVNGTGTAIGEGRLSKADNSIELRIPWSALGSAGGPLSRVRFSAAILRTNGSTPSDSVASSNILDVVSPRATEAELADDKLDYAFDVPFDTVSGEVASPLLITELVPLVGTDTKSQWFEITNVSPSTISASELAQYKVGDASNKDSTEGLFRLPSRSLASNQSIIVARQRNTFRSKYPAATYTGLDYGTGSGSSVGGNVFGLFNDQASGGGTNLLEAYTPATWLANSSIEPSSAFQLPVKLVAGESSYADQLVLLDAQDTIVDLVEYASPGTTNLYPDHVPLAVPAAGISGDTAFQRCPASRDTNNDPVDFAQTTLLNQQTPGNACVLADLYITKSGLTNVVTSVTAPVQQTYTIQYGNHRLDSAGVVVSDTLPLGMSYVATQSSAGLAEPTQTTNGGRTTLQWAVGSVVSGATGTITVTTSLPANTAPATTSNDVSISGTTAEVELLNNTFSLPISYVTEPTVDIGVTKRIANASQLYQDGFIVYEIGFDNTGTKIADAVTLLDSVPTGLVYESNSLGLAASTPASQQVQFDLGSLAPSPVQQTMLVTFTVAPDAVVGSSVQNQVSIATTTTPELVTNNNTAQSEAAVIATKPPVADLAVTKRVKDGSAAYPGGQVVYEITYRNAGTIAAEDVALVDSVPAGLVYSSNNLGLAASVENTNQLRLNIGDLEAQSTVQTLLVTFSVAPSAAVGSSVVNTVAASTSSLESPITNNRAVSEAQTLGAAPSAELSVATTVVDSTKLYPGGSISYQISVTNEGMLPAEGVSLLDTVPTNLQYQSNSSNLPGIAVNSTQIQFALGTIAPGTTTRMIITFGVPNNQALPNTTVQNAVSVTTTTTEGNTSNNAATSETRTIQPVLVSGPRPVYLPMINR